MKFKFGSVMNPKTNEGADIIVKMSKGDAFEIGAMLGVAGLLTIAAVVTSFRVGARAFDVGYNDALESIGCITEG